MAIFVAPNTTPGRDRHMRPLTFCMKFNSRQLLFQVIFDIIAYFWQRSVVKCIYFAVFVHFNVSKMAIFGALSSTPGGDKDTLPLSYRKFNFRQLLIEQFFDIICTFGSIQPKTEPTFPYQRIISKMVNLWWPVAPLLGQVEIYVQRVFLYKI